MNTILRSLLLLLCATTAYGAATGDPKKCFGIDDDAQRLSCYDATLGRPGPAASTPKAVATPAAPTAAAATGG